MYELSESVIIHVLKTSFIMFTQNYHAFYCSFSILSFHNHSSFGSPVVLSVTYKKRIPSVLSYVIRFHVTYK